MKKHVALLLTALLLLSLLAPSALAGKNNTVNDVWYYNDPDGTAYLGGTRDPDYPYIRTPSGLIYAPSPDTPYKADQGILNLGSRTLKRTYPYMRGSDIRALQTMLNALGYSCGKVDGIFGNQTRAAVRSFQSRNGLKVDGIVGPKTRARLLSRYRNIK